MIKAADVVRAHELLWLVPERDELRDLLRRCIAGLSPEEADAALVDLFHEIDVLEDVTWESCGFRRLTPEEIEEEKRRFGGKPPC
jgi:hypothetical protein